MSFQNTPNGQNATMDHFVVFSKSFQKIKPLKIFFKATEVIGGSRTTPDN
jgi:hypothetical protein